MHSHILNLLRRLLNPLGLALTHCPHGLAVVDAAAYRLTHAADHHRARCDAVDRQRHVLAATSVMRASFVERVVAAACLHPLTSSVVATVGKRVFGFDVHAIHWRLRRVRWFGGVGLVRY